MLEVHYTIIVPWKSSDFSPEKLTTEKKIIIKLFTQRSIYHKPHTLRIKKLDTGFK